MPSYKYKCNSCEKTETKQLQSSKRLEPLKEKCSCGATDKFIVIGGAAIVSGVSVKDKRPSGWKDVLKRAHKSAGKHSTINV